MHLDLCVRVLYCVIMIRFDEENRTVKKEECRAVLAGIDLGNGTKDGAGSIEHSMAELEGLAEAAGADVIGVMIQKADRINPATFLGKGKVEELAQMCQNTEADTIIFNNELSGMQIRNLEDMTGMKIVDRTVLVLDIFASRATSREGRLQVELAQLKYRMPRLMGFGKALSRLGGGIGTRGPGEKKLETDRRHIARRMDDIEAEIRHIKATREVQRAKRKKNGIPVVALVGYTNAGKSALMNRLLGEAGRQDKQVFSEDMLFATLDVRQRRVEREKGKSFVLTDTVGFVSDLPHALVNAFRATLEEVVYADLLLHVVDASYEDYDFQIDVTESVLKELGADGKDTVIVYNKVDVVREELIDASGREHIYVSAKTGYNIESLLEIIDEKLFGGLVEGEFMVPYDRGDIVSYICDNGSVLNREYTESGTKIKAVLSGEAYGKVKEYDTL